MTRPKIESPCVRVCAVDGQTGLCLGCGRSLQEIGGWEELRATAGSDHFNMWRPISDPDFPWTGMLIGGTILMVGY